MTTAKSTEVTLILGELDPDCDFAHENGDSPLADVFRRASTTPVTSVMLSTRAAPIYLERTLDLECGLGATFSHTVGVQPCYFRTWAIRTRAELEHVRRELREGRETIPGDVNVDAEITRILNYTDGNTLDSSVIAYAAQAGVSMITDAIILGSVTAMTNPDEHEIWYQVHIDIIYTRPSRRGRGAATAAAWGANHRLGHDIDHLDDEIAALPGQWTLQTSLHGEIHHDAAHHLALMLDATMSDAPLANFNKHDHLREWGW